MDINSTKEAPKPTVLADTLRDMNEWDINKLNDSGKGSKKD